MRSLFESLFTTKDIVRAKYPNGWVGWLNDKMSDDDDGRLTRFTTMDGRYMYIIVERLIDYGFRPRASDNLMPVSDIRAINNLFGSSIFMHSF